MTPPPKSLQSALNVFPIRPYKKIGITGHTFMSVKETGKPTINEILHSRFIQQAAQGHQVRCAYFRRKLAILICVSVHSASSSHVFNL